MKTNFNLFAAVFMIVILKIPFHFQVIASGQTEKKPDFYRGIIEISDSLRKTDNWRSRDTLLYLLKDIGETKSHLQKNSHDYQDFNCIEGEALIKLGWTYYSLSELPEALSCFQKAMDIYGTFPGNDKEIINMTAEIKLGFGVLQFQQENFDQAMSYVDESVSMFEKTGDKKGMISACINKAHIYHAMCFTGKDTWTLAIEFFMKSLEIARSLEDMDNEIHILINLGGTYHDWGKFELAEKYYRQAGDQIEKKLAGQPNDTRMNAMLGAVYTCLGNLFSDKGEGEKSLAWREKGYQYALRSKSKGQIIFSGHCLHGDYARNKRFEDAYNTLIVCSQTNDSVYNEKSSRQLKEMEAKYQNQLKQSEIERQKAEIGKQQMIRNSFILGFALMVIISFLAIRSYIMKRRSNKIIEEKNQILSQANEEISAQRDEIESQRDEIEAQRDQVISQRDLIMEHKKEITDSILYAKRIQSAILPLSGLLEESFCDHFIMFRPRDIVSGDFYWFTKVEEKLVVAVADCTGHGVPGAFMSMLGTAYLNEIVNKEFITHPGVILRRLRKEIIRALQQHGDTGDGTGKMKDGMDIALCSFDFENKVCLFAGANNPIYLISKRKGTEQKRSSYSGTPVLTEVKGTVSPVTPVLTEVKGDKMPIAIYEKMDNFITQEIPIMKGDQLYFFSDGFADQFGGPTEGGKKYKYST
ncbi:MAG: tetratricopeptide repeat protein, partial [Bacteroidota bacterium]